MEGEKLHRKFEEIPVWIKARELTREIYFAARQKPFSFDRGLVDQITRAAVSIMSNIAEGVERGTTADLICFLFYAKGSAGEVRSQLYVAEDQNYISQDRAGHLRHLAENIPRQLSAWIQSMQSIDFNQGPKFHKEPSKLDIRHEEWKKCVDENIRKTHQSLDIK